VPPTAGVRLFADHAGRRWSAAWTGRDGIVTFTCRSDPRERRAMAAEPADGLAVASEATLRARLAAAPRVAYLP
jgi:hypothetical protein